MAIGSLGGEFGGNQFGTGQAAPGGGQAAVQPSALVAREGE
jgi:hypothetical protein